VVPTLPLFCDDGPPATVAGARIEGHETPTYRDGKHFPVVEWRVESLTLGQPGFTRDEISSTTNHGDSSLPTFALVGDQLGFIGQEVYLSGNGRANWRGYWEALKLAKLMDPTVHWDELRWSPPSEVPPPVVVEPKPDNPPLSPPEPIIVEVPVPQYPTSVVLLFLDGTEKEYPL